MRKNCRILMVVLLLIIAISANTATVEAKTITVFSQTDSRWANVPYGKGPGGVATTLGPAGCGILSYVNAIYYLNGSFIEPSFLAKYSVDNGHRENGVGTRFSLYKAFADSYGANYGFKYVCSLSSVGAAKSYLKNGDTAVLSVQGHLIALVDYDSSTDKYLILDSYKSSNRGTYSTGYRWLKESEFTGKLAVSGGLFLFRNTGTVSVVDTNETNLDSRYPTPITAYPRATSGKITVYNNSGVAYSQSSHYISYNDLCTIQSVYKNGFCKVVYPTSGSTFTALAKTSDFIASTDTPYNYKPEKSYTTYTRSNLNTTFGSVFTTDTCKVVANEKVDDYSRKYQLIYPVSGGYKLGWIIKTDPRPSPFPVPVLGYNASPSNRTTVYQTEATLGGTQYGQIFVDDFCTINYVDISKNYVNVTYPISNGTKTGFAYFDQFFPSFVGQSSIYSTKVSANTTAYRKSDMSTSIGTIYPSDTVTVIGKSGNKLQVVYPLTEGTNKGKYKLGWITSDKIVKNLLRIAVSSNPSKVTYLEGESFDKNGLIITGYYDDGSSANITGSCSLSGYSSSPGTKTITVTCSGKTTAFTVVVNSKSPDSLSITQNPSKTTYYLGEDIDITGLKATAKYNNNTTADVSGSVYLLNDIDTGSAGTKTATVQYSYNGKVVSASFTIKIIGKEMSTGYDRILPDGKYMIVSAADPSYYLDIAGGDASAANGKNVQLYGPNSGTIPVSDTWTITYSDGFYSIRQNGSNAALDVNGGSAELQANVQAWEKNSNSCQKWAISYFDGGKGYRIQSKCSGMSLDITGGTISAGTNIEMYTGNSSDAQRWLFIPMEPAQTVEDGRYILISGLDPHVELDVPGNTGDLSDGTNIQIWNDRAQTRWNSFDVSYAGNGYYHLIHAASGKYLEVNGSSTDNYGNIQISAPTGGNNQRWSIIPQNGGYMLINRNSGLIMDVDNGKTEDATNVRQHYYNGSKAQTWMFKKAEYTVKYDANGGTGAPASQTKYYANELTLSSSAPSDENRIFKGWATDKNALTAQYQPGDSYTADSSVTLYAVWETLEAPVLTGIRIKRNPDKTVYNEGESLDTSGLQIEASYSDGTNKTVKSGFTCSPEMLDSAGTQVITVTYEEKTATFQVTVNAISDPNPGASGSVSVPNLIGSPGSTIAVPVRINVNPGIIGINLSLGYDGSRLKLVKVESGEILDGSSMSGNYTKNPYKLSLSNDTSTENIEETGVLATAFFEILKDAEEGDAAINLSFEEAYDKDLNEVTFETVNGKITVQSYKPGDVNGDGEVKLNDAILLRRFVAGWDVEINETAADVNRDGQVKLNDAILLRRYVAGWDVVLK